MLALIPARNEAPRVAAVIRAAAPHVERVVVVVNGCTDDTAERASEAGAEVIESEPGYARALHAGYRHLRGHPLVQLDADGQHPPEAIPALIAGLRQADLVLGSRFLGEGSYRVPLPRRAAISAFSLALRGLSGLRVRDVTTGYMALSGRAVELFARDFPDEVTDAVVLMRAHRAGLRVAEVPVAMRAREGGASMHTVSSGLRYCGRMAGLLLRERVALSRVRGGWGS